MTFLSAVRQIVDRLDKPELVWRPQQIATFLFAPQPANGISVKLPWGLSATVYPDDQIGEIVRRKGLYDLIVCEAIWRLVSKGSVAIDVGANLGYMTSIMAAQAGPSGSVLAFEPHPTLCKQLEDHVKLWLQEAGITNTTVYQAAVSNAIGEGSLLQPTGFRGNKAICKLTNLDEDKDEEAGSYYDVKTVTLDSVCREKYDRIDLVKIDVEGAELLVLSGADQLLTEHRIRNVIIEDFEPYPSERLKFLEDRGYQIFMLGRTFVGPKLCLPSNPEGLHWGESPNYLATLDRDAVEARFKGWGWQCLSNHTP